MSVQLHRVTSQGSECPKCKNDSVFVDDIRTCFWGVYRYTLKKCYVCDYKKLTDKKEKKNK